MVTRPKRAAPPPRPSEPGAGFHLKLLKRTYRLGARLTKAVPPSVRYPLAALGGTAWWAADSGRRRAARANYAAVLDLDEGHPEVGRVMRRACANYGRMLADFLLMGDLSPDEIDQVTTADGRGYLDRALEGGRGAILAVPHMGSWDFAASRAGVWGYRVAAVAERFPGSLDEAVTETRSSHGLEIIPLDRSAVRSVERVLDGNGTVALLCDLPHGPGVEVELFGRRAVVPAGPAAFACRRQAPILPACSVRTGRISYHIHVDPPLLAPAGGGQGKAAQAELMQRVMRRFEVFIRAHPDQWYAFRPILH